MNVDNIIASKFRENSKKTYISVKGCTLSDKYAELKPEIDNLSVNENDVWVCTFPKSGTTWTQEIVWMILNNLDFETGKRELSERSPFVEFSSIHDYKIDERVPLCVKDSVGFYKSCQSPVVVKTHLPFDLLPLQAQKGKAKMIYVARNPKDTCVSYYHHARLLMGFIGDFDDFCELFLAGKLMWAPYWKHVLSYWDVRKMPNVFFLRFEDMKRDIKRVIREVSEFLGRPLDDNQVDILAQHVSFESMKKNPAVNKEGIVRLNRELTLTDCQGEFMRSGTVGDHKNVMSEEMSKRFDAWIADNVKGTDYVV